METKYEYVTINFIEKDKPTLRNTADERLKEHYTPKGWEVVKERTISVRVKEKGKKVNAYNCTVELRNPNT
jgi:hypothetical protein